MSPGVTIYALTTAIIGFFSVVALLLLLAPVELCNNVLPGVMLPVNSNHNGNLPTNNTALGVIHNSEYDINSTGTRLHWTGRLYAHYMILHSPESHPTFQHCTATIVTQHMCFDDEPNHEIHSKKLCLPLAWNVGLFVMLILLLVHSIVVYVLYRALTTARRTDYTAGRDALDEGDHERAPGKLIIGLTMVGACLGCATMMCAAMANREYMAQPWTTSHESETSMPDYPGKWSAVMAITVVMNVLGIVRVFFMRVYRIFVHADRTIPQFLDEENIHDDTYQQDEALDYALNGSYCSLTDSPLSNEVHEPFHPFNQAMFEETMRENDFETHTSSSSVTVISNEVDVRMHIQKMRNEL